MSWLLVAVDGEGERRGGEGWSGEKGFWVSGIGEKVGVEGCVDGTGEGGMTGSDSGLETVEGEDLDSWRVIHPDVERMVCE